MAMRRLPSARPFGDGRPDGGLRRAPRSLSRPPGRELRAAALRGESPRRRRCHPAFARPLVEPVGPRARDLHRCADPRLLRRSSARRATSPGQPGLHAAQRRPDGATGARDRARVDRRIRRFGGRRISTTCSPLPCPSSSSPRCWASHRMPWRTSSGGPTTRCCVSPAVTRRATPTRPGSSGSSSPRPFAGAGPASTPARTCPTTS